MMSWTEATLKTLAGFSMVFIGLICSVVMIDAVAAGDFVDYIFNTVSKSEWKQYFSDIPLPDRTELFTSGLDTGQIDTGNSKELDYGYYWVVESDLAKEELAEYYTSYAEESNLKFSGYETIIEVCQSDKRSFGCIFHQLDSIWDQIKEKDEANHIWIIAAYKPGRGWLKN
jgi:hypothetical protein